MANATQDLVLDTVGHEGRKLYGPLAAAALIYGATFVSQLTASGLFVRSGTALSGPVVGMSTHRADNSAGAASAKSLEVETDRIFIVNNGAGGDACSILTPLGAPLYVVDDNTVGDNDNAGARQLAGFFWGMEPDGRVRCYVDLVRNQMFASLAAAIAAL